MSEEEWDKICADTGSRQPPVNAEGFWSPKGGADWPWPVMLKRLRLIRGLTQRELAHEAGMVQSHVAKAEAGSEVQWTTMNKLIAALGCRLFLRVRPVVPFEIR